MIIYKTNGLIIYETRSDCLSSDWTGGKAEHIIDECAAENTKIIAKIKRYAPYCELVLDDAGNVIDVAPTESPAPTPAPTVWDEIAAAYQEGVNSIDE